VVHPVLHFQHPERLDRGILLRAAWRGNPTYGKFDNFSWSVGPPANDIGLRAYDGTGTIKIACEVGTATSPLRISKNGTTYGILLVATNDTTASKIRIPTSSGVKAVMKLP